jgi:hypothetical protein
MPVSGAPRTGRILRPQPRYFDPDRFSAIYENPVTGWREGVPKLAWLWLLLFLGPYLLLRRMWQPLIFTLVVGFVSALIFLPLVFLAGVVLAIVAAINREQIFREHYTKLGWYEIDPWHQFDEEE